MLGIGNRGWLAGVTLLVALLIAGCAARRGPVPVEDRGTMTSATVAAPSAAGVPTITTDASGKPLPGIENYGKPGYYAVRPGDTIRRIGTETGQSWQNIARWNNLDNPDLIEVGQVLRVIPPVGATASAAAPASATGTTDASSAVTRPVTQAAVAPSSGAAGLLRPRRVRLSNPPRPSSPLHLPRRLPRHRAMKMWVGSGLRTAR